VAFSILGGRATTETSVELPIYLKGPTPLKGNLSYQKLKAPNPPKSGQFCETSSISKTSPSRATRRALRICVSTPGCSSRNALTNSMVSLSGRSSAVSLSRPRPGSRKADLGKLALDFAKEMGGLTEDQAKALERHRDWLTGLAGLTGPTEAGAGRADRGHTMNDALKRCPSPRK
jgi:hypothetical protein